MKKGFLSRRSFLQGTLKTIGTVCIAHVTTLIPETRSVLARAHRAKNLPWSQFQDLEVTPLPEDEAQQLLHQAFNHQHTRQLLTANAQFHQQAVAPTTMTATWKDEDGLSHTGNVAAISYVDDSGTEAVLFFSDIEGQTGAVLTILLQRDQHTIRAEVHLVEGEHVRVEPIVLTKPTTSSQMQTSSTLPAQVPPRECTQDCLIFCIQQYGCGGLGLTLCITALLTCPFFLATCFAAFACTLYCGSAFSICWTDICCVGEPLPQ